MVAAVGTGTTVSPCAICLDPGACCRYVLLPLARGLTPDEQQWVGLHPGLSIVDNRNVLIRSNCSALTAQGQCFLYGEAARPQMCSVWPDRPELQAPQLCGYRTSGVGAGVRPQ